MSRRRDDADGMTTTTSPQSTSRATERLFTPAFIGLGVADLAYFTAIGMSILVLPLYVTGPVGSSTAFGFAGGIS